MQTTDLGPGVAATTLANGIRVLTEEMSHVRSISVGIWISGGSRREASENNGISHFIEHMLFKGTTSRSAEEIARSVDSIGGHLDAFTSKELVSFNTKVLDEHLPFAFDVISDIVLNPLFREEDIEKEKGVILEELKMDVDNPEYLVHELFSSNFWKDHPLGRPILGTRETVKRFRRETVESHYRGAYTPTSIVVTAAGNLRHETLIALVRERFEPLTRPDGLPSISAPQTHARITTRSKKELEQVHLCLGVPCYSFPHEKRYACYILNTVLGGGMSSRLFQNIREKRGLAYAVFSELNMYRDSGCLSIYAGTSLESTREVVHLILEEFRQLKNDLLPADEIRRAKDNLKGSLMLGLESTSSRMANLARQEIFFGRFMSMDELLANIEQVTQEQVRTIAEEFFDPRNIALTVLGNLDGFKITREELSC